MRHYPNRFIEEYLKYTAEREATERINKWSIISVIAAAMERRFWLDRGHYQLFPNLYVFIIGKSGLIKKSTSTGIAVNLFRELKGARMMSERLTAGSLVRQLAESGKQFDLFGRKINQSPLFAYASELSVFLDEVYGNITELLTTFYDCIPNDSSKPWIHRTVKDGEVQIYGPCLNILGASTKTWLRKCIPRTEMEGGFTSRCIFVVENNVPIAVAWPTLSIENELRRVQLTQDLQHIYSLKGEMHVTKEAKQYFGLWYNNHVSHAIPSNEDPALSGYMARKGDLILKLAMVRSISCRDDLKIGISDIDWAMTEIDRLEVNWKMAFEGLQISPKLGFQIKEFVFKRAHCTRSELWKVFAPDNMQVAVDAELELLVEMEEVEMVRRDPAHPFLDEVQVPGLRRRTYNVETDRMDPISSPEAPEPN